MILYLQIAIEDFNARLPTIEDHAHRLEFTRHLRKHDIIGSTNSTELWLL